MPFLYGVPWGKPDLKKIKYPPLSGLRIYPAYMDSLPMQNNLEVVLNFIHGALLLLTGAVNFTKNLYEVGPLVW